MGIEDGSVRLDESILHVVLDLLPGTLHVKDRELRYQIVNRNYLERWNVRACDLIGRTSEEAFGEFFGDGPDLRNRQVLKTGQALPFYEVSYPNSSGSRNILWATKVPILDRAGDATHVLTFSLDITPLKQVERQLSESEKIRSATFQHSLDCLITTNEDGAIIEFNPSAEAVFGYLRSDVVGTPVTDVLLPPEGLPRSDQLTGNACSSLLARAAQRFETHGRRRNGEFFPVEVSLAEVPLHDRRLFTAHVRDLTDHHRAQMELAKQRQALRLSERMSVLGTLAAGISHELRNPLSVILAQAKLLENEISAQQGLSEPLGHRLGSVVNAAERCSAIVSSFLDHSRSQPHDIERFEVSSMVDSALDLCANVIREHSVVLRKDYAEHTPIVAGNKHQLSQVVLNIVLNACAAMGENAGPRELVVSCHSNAASQLCEISIADSGPGISAELQSKVFEHFFTTKPPGEGTGLGLAICRDIVTQHNGRIELRRSSFGGACFIVSLPMSDGATIEFDTTLQSQAHTSSKKILVVDDETEVAELLGEILELAGHTVNISNSATAALELLQAEEYDAILSDMRMPEVDGSQFFQLLGERYPNMLARIAFITGDTLAAGAEHFLNTSGVPSIGKPFMPDEIVAMVASLTASTQR